MRIAAHLQLAPKEPPLADPAIEPFLHDLFDAFQVLPAAQGGSSLHCTGPAAALAVVEISALEVAGPGGCILRPA